ncbi:hypothetical protein EDC01DRAFT_680202, partial [Geopyxis carbonaria]
FLNRKILRMPRKPFRNLQRILNAALFLLVNKMGHSHVSLLMGSYPIVTQSFKADSVFSSIDNQANFPNIFAEEQHNDSPGPLLQSECKPEYSQEEIVQHAIDKAMKNEKHRFEGTRYSDYYGAPTRPLHQFAGKPEFLPRYASQNESVQFGNSRVHKGPSYPEYNGGTEPLLQSGCKPEYSPEEILQHVMDQFTKIEGDQGPPYTEYDGGTRPLPQGAVKPEFPPRNTPQNESVQFSDSKVYKGSFYPEEEYNGSNLNCMCRPSKPCIVMNKNVCALCAKPISEKEVDAGFPSAKYVDTGFPSANAGGRKIRRKRKRGNVNSL